MDCVAVCNQPRGWCSVSQADPLHMSAEIQLSGKSSAEMGESAGLTRYMPMATITTAAEIVNVRLCSPGFFAASFTSWAFSAQHGWHLRLSCPHH